MKNTSSVHMIGLIYSIFALCQSVGFGPLPTPLVFKKLGDLHEIFTVSDCHHRTVINRRAERSSQLNAKNVLLLKL